MDVDMIFKIAAVGIIVAVLKKWQRRTGYADYTCRINRGFINAGN